MSHKIAKRLRKELKMGSNGEVKGDLPIIPNQQPGYQVAVQFTTKGMVVGVFGPEGMTLPAILNHLLAGSQAITVEMMKKEQEAKSRIVIPEFGGVVPFKH